MVLLRMKLRITLLLLMVLVAGCADARPPFEEGCVPWGEYHAPLCPSATASSTGAPENQTVSNVTTTLETVEWADAKPMYAYAYSYAANRSVEVGDWLTHYVLSSLNVTHATLTLSWAPTSPLTRELQMAVFGNYTTDDSLGYDWRRLTPTVRGFSPVALDAPVDTDLIYHEALIMVGHINQTPGSDFYVIAGTEQPFRVEGTIYAQEAGR